MTPDRSSKQSIQDLAALTLFICFFSLVVGEILTAAGLLQWANFRNFPSLDQFVRDNGLDFLEPVAQALIVTALVMLLMLGRERILSSATKASETSFLARMGNLGPYAVVLAALCSICVGLINAYVFR